MKKSVIYLLAIVAFIALFCIIMGCGYLFYGDVPTSETFIAFALIFSFWLGFNVVKGYLMDKHYPKQEEKEPTEAK